MVFLKINRLYLTNKKIYTNKLNIKLKITTFQTKILQNIKLFIKIIKNNFIQKNKKNSFTKKKKNFSPIKKNNVFITQFKYINNQHYINIILTK